MTKNVRMKEKNDARKKCLNKETRKNREEYEEKRKIATKLCRRKKREMWNKKIKEIKGANIKKNVRKFYKEVKETSKEHQQQNIIYKDDKEKNINGGERYIAKMATVFSALVRR